MTLCATRAVLAAALLVAVAGSVAVVALVRTAGESCCSAEESGPLRERARRQALELASLRKRLHEAGVREQVLLVQDEVSAVRALALKDPLNVRVIDREGLRRMLRERMEEDYPGEELRSHARLLVALGLLDGPVDLSQLIVEQNASQIAAVYDERSREVVFISDMPVEGYMGDMLLVHEITHALQDQHFSLDTRVSRRGRNDDLTLAALAVIEGDATLVMMESLQLNTDAAGLDSMAGLFASASGAAEVPAFMLQELMFPYTSGLEFVSSLHQRGGWSAVNAAYDDMPRSTEQILHPEKYQGSRDEPQEIELPGSLAGGPGQGWQATISNRMGEFKILALLQHFLEPGRASDAASGWDGDVYAAFERDSDLVFVWKSAWDSTADAVEFRDAYGAVISKRCGRPAGERQAGSRWHCGGRAGFLSVSGDEVMVIEGPEPGLVDALVRTLPRPSGKTEAWMDRH